MQLSKLQNDVLVGRKAVPEKEKVERELVNAQISLKECEQMLRSLETAVENANDPQRLRVLPGDCPSRNELTNRIEKLEVGLRVAHIVDCVEKSLKNITPSLQGMYMYKRPSAIDYVFQYIMRTFPNKRSHC